MSENRRRHTRLEMELPVELCPTNGHPITGTIVNMSFSGLLADFDDIDNADGDWEDTIMIRISFDTKAGTPASVTMDSRLVRKIPPDSVAFEFISTTREDYELFMNLMLERADLPDILLEELEQYPGLGAK